MKKKIWLMILAFAVLLIGCQKTKVPETTNQPENTLKPEDQKEAENTQEPTESEEPGQLVTEPSQIMGMAAEMLENMTLEEKIGQLFMVNFESLDDSQGNFYEFTKLTKEMKKNLETYPVGGVVFFSRNIETIKQTKKFISKLQETTKTPLFIAVDEEGGRVARIANNKQMKTTKFPSMKEVGAMEDEEYAYQMGVTIAKEIKELGFNFNFAPVADVRTNEKNTEIGDRSFGSDEKVVGNMVKQVVLGLSSQNIISTLKHFPGHGDVGEDSHKGAVDVESDITRLRKVDFVPFKAGIKAGADCIMVSHISISRVTGSTKPASMTKLVMHDMLRTEFSFEGVVITDAMNMKAITNFYNAGEAALTALQNGADIVLIPNDLKKAFTTVLKAANEGEFSEKQINEKVERILRLKIKRGIILREKEI